MCSFGRSAEVALDLADRADLGVIRVLAGSRAGSTLPQQIPALVELLFQGGQLSLFLVGGQLASPESLAQGVLSIDQITDALEQVTFLDHPAKPLLNTMTAAIPP